MPSSWCSLIHVASGRSSRRRFVRSLAGMLPFVASFAWTVNGWADPALQASKARALTAMPHVAGSASRSCGPLDLLGTWALMTYGTDHGFRDAQAPYLYPYQVFRFSRDGVLQSAHSPTAFVETPERVLSRLPVELKYAFDAARPGIVAVTRPSEPGVSEVWGCRILTIDHLDLTRRTIMKRGDILMLLMGKAGEPRFIRHLRKQ